MFDIKTGLKYSFLAHIVLLFLVIHPGCPGCGGGSGKGEKPNPQQGEENKDKIEEKTKKDSKETIEVELTDAPVLKKKPQPKHANIECPSGLFYGGLGIYEAQVDGKLIVTEAVKGYPGADVGLESGDIILSPAADDITGEIGTEVDLVVKKQDGTIKNYTAVRDKICLVNTP